jgi:glycosyltransferase involved in cell wall biosynthesis
MKVISLLPVKNESWILRFSLKNFSLFSDEILILDDGSQDQLLELIKEFPKVSIIPFSIKEDHVDMSLRRNTLLTEGRIRGGTHFVCLDADEIFSQTTISTLFKILPTLGKGETLLLPWIILGKDPKNEILYFDTKDKKSYKDFIFCDDGISVYDKKFLSESRTPGKDLLKKIIPFEEGYVLHFIYIAGKRTQLKQAWYRASELIEGTRSARKINATYAVTKSPIFNNKELLDEIYTRENFYLIEEKAGYEFYIQALQKIFSKKGILFFEPLDIWHIEELRNLFIKEVGREPKPKTFPLWLLHINDVKNIVRNCFYQHTQRIKRS